MDARIDAAPMVMTLGTVVAGVVAIKTIAIGFINMLQEQVAAASVLRPFLSFGGHSLSAVAPSNTFTLKEVPAGAL